MFGQRQQQEGYYGEGQQQSGGSMISSRLKLTLIIGAIMAAFSLLKYYGNSQINPITGENQRVSISTEQEVALGLQSAPSMVQQHGGLHPDQRAQQYVKQVGQKLITNTIAQKSNYPYEFHLLADPEVVNAFALPGGQVFITLALLEKLENEDQLAGVLGHEVGHVIHRHGAERIAKMELTQGLTGAAVLAAGDYNSAQFAQMVGNLINMKYGRDQELESDDFGVRLMLEAGYDAKALVGVMDILEKASGGSRQPEFQSSHPSPENRREKILEAVEKYKGSVQ
jgi:beta-barrel assembly-enhancing protease